MRRQKKRYNPGVRLLDVNIVKLFQLIDWSLSSERGVIFKEECGLAVASDPRPKCHLAASPLSLLHTDTGYCASLLRSFSKLWLV